MAHGGKNSFGWNLEVMPPPPKEVGCVFPHGLDVQVCMYVCNLTLMCMNQGTASLRTA